MARTPINARRGFFYKPNRNTNVRVALQWNVVDTDLGPMVEPRQFGLAVDGKITQIDLLDAAADSEGEMEAATFYSQYGTDGQQLMYDFSY